MDPRSELQSNLRRAALQQGTLGAVMGSAMSGAPARANAFSIFEPDNLFEGTPGDPPSFSDYNLNYNRYNPMFHSEDRIYPTHGQFRELFSRLQGGR